MPALAAGTKIVGDVVAALKDHPFLLAMWAIIVIMIGVIVFEMRLIFDMQAEVNALLTKCVDLDVLKHLGIVK